MARAAVLRLRDALQEVIAGEAGDAATSNRRVQARGPSQPDSTREMVRVAKELLAVVDGHGAPARPSPGERLAGRARFDRTRAEDEPSPGQKAAARARAGLSRGDVGRRPRGTAGEAFDMLEERGGLQ
jgi:hypothetical protein